VKRFSDLIDDPRSTRRASYSTTPEEREALIQLNLERIAEGRVFLDADEYMALASLILKPDARDHRLGPQGPRKPR
jgi:hypothetical protein